MVDVQGAPVVDEVSAEAADQIGVLLLAQGLVEGVHVHYQRGHQRQRSSSHSHTVGGKAGVHAGGSAGRAGVGISVVSWEGFIVAMAIVGRCR